MSFSYPPIPTGAVPTMVFAPVKNLHEIRVNPDDLQDISDALGFDFLYDHEYKAVRILTVKALIEQAQLSSDSDEHETMPVFLAGILEEIKNRLDETTDSIMFVPDDSVPARG